MDLSQSGALKGNTDLSQDDSTVTTATGNGNFIEVGSIVTSHL